MLNTRKPPFDNIHARRALAMGIDRAAIADTVSSGEQLGMDTSPFAESSKWGGLAPDETGYPAYDPEAAKAEIEQYKADTGSRQSQLDLLRSRHHGRHQPHAERGRAVAPDRRRRQDRHHRADRIHRQARRHRLPSGFLPWLPGSRSRRQLLLLEQGDRRSQQPHQHQLHGVLEPDHRERRDLGSYGHRRSRLASPATKQLVKDRNAAAVDLWLFNTPYSLIGETNLRGLNWFRKIGFGNFLPKPWMGGLWIDQNASTTNNS